MNEALGKLAEAGERPAAVAPDLDPSASSLLIEIDVVWGLSRQVVDCTRQRARALHASSHSVTRVLWTQVRAMVYVTSIAAGILTAMEGVEAALETALTHQTTVWRTTSAAAERRKQDDQLTTPPPPLPLLMSLAVLPIFNPLTPPPMEATSHFYKDCFVAEV